MNDGVPALWPDGVEWMRQDDRACQPEARVRLTQDELEIAAIIAIKRSCQDIFLNRKDAYGAKREEGWQLSIEGTAGEMAVAKWCNRYWNGNLGDLKADDVGRLQVRTGWRDDSRLILHPSDRDDRAFILVTGLAPIFVLRGWIWARDGKKAEYWRDPAGGRPAFFVPQRALRPMKPGRAT
jgi:hypothetical protein